MLPREPWDFNEPFYCLLPTMDDPKNSTVNLLKVIRTPFGLDMNRNFLPLAPKCSRCGDFPTSEQEVRGVVEFITKHPNIALANSYHTSGGIFFRNPYQYGDDAIDQTDLKLIRAVAAEGTKVTGYPDVKSSNRACLPEWLYEHQNRQKKKSIKENRVMGSSWTSRASIKHKLKSIYSRRNKKRFKFVCYNERSALIGLPDSKLDSFQHPQ
jgi:hypothetical protein